MHGGSVKPGSITYGVRDVPPVSTVIPLVMQHVAMLSVELVFPVIVVTMAGGSVDMARDAVSLMMIAMGVGTILQALQKGPVGSGYFCAHETGTAYFPAVIATIQAGGVGLMSGMVLVSGLMQMLFSRLIHRLRILFPSEIIGLIIVMMAFSYISYGMTAFWGVGGAHHAAVTTTQEALFVGFFTLLIIVSLYIWGGKKMREYAILAGMVVGYASAWITGIIDSEDLSRLAAAPVLTFPNLYGGWTFDLKFLPAFAVAALCSSIITIGNMSTCQKVNEVDWRRLDLKSAGNGLFAEGLATSVSGLLGALPQTTSPGSVGLSVATGVTSRYLGFVVGALLIVLSFFSQVATFLAIMPKPVIGVILLVEISFIFPAGMQVCTSRMLDFRKMFVLGLALAFGMAVDIVPGISKTWPGWLAQLFNSPIAMASLIAIILTLLFRIGIASHQIIEFELKDYPDRLALFMEENGEAWGARREVIHRVLFALEELMQILEAEKLVSGQVKLDVSFEEFNMAAHVSYSGIAPVLAKIRPSDEELLEEDGALSQLSGFLIRKYARKIKIEEKEGLCHIYFNFEH
jgi:NCS2 family nucleobase:cation symporter-2